MAYSALSEIVVTSEAQNSDEDMIYSSFSSHKDGQIDAKTENNDKGVLQNSDEVKLGASIKVSIDQYGVSSKDSRLKEDYETCKKFVEIYNTKPTMVIVVEGISSALIFG